MSSVKHTFVLFLFFLLASVADAISLSLGFTSIPSGYVGVEAWFGQIQQQYRSGVTWYNPLTTSVKHVKTVQDTDKLSNVPCVSREGVTINVPSIEIANRIDPAYVVDTVKRFGFEYDTVLVLNPLGQRMRELCAERTVDEIEITHFKDLDDLLQAAIQDQVDAIGSGITIDWVRVTNVVVPQAIKDKRLELASEKAQRAVAQERHLRELSEKEHAEKIAKKTMELNTLQKVSEIDLNRKDDDARLDLLRRQADTENEISRKKADNENEILRKEATLRDEIRRREGETEAANIEKLAKSFGSEGLMKAHYGLLSATEWANGKASTYYFGDIPNIVGGNTILTTPFQSTVVAETNK